MKQRIITGVALVIILIGVLTLGTPFVEIAVVLLALGAVIELFNATELINKKSLLIVSLIGTVILVASNVFDDNMFMPALYVFVVTLFITYMLTMEKNKFSDISKILFITIYSSFFFGHIILVRNTDYGYLLIWLVLIGAFVTDTAAMFGGRFFGKHKLCPKLSPKKTVEGSICGIAGCIIGTFILCLIGKVCFDLQPNYLWATVVGLGSSLIAQVGDLSASCIKRQFGIKDYGKIMPGHGGVLDRCDSILFVAPFVYYMSLIYPIFG